jgi:hypothetical protein
LTFLPNELPRKLYRIDFDPAPLLKCDGATQSREERITDHCDARQRSGGSENVQ